MQRPLACSVRAFPSLLFRPPLRPTIHPFSSYSVYAGGTIPPRGGRGRRSDGETAGVRDGFSRTRERLETIVSFLVSDVASTLSHGELEERIGADGRELLRQLFQDHLDLRAEREVRLRGVTDANAVPRRAAEAGHVRVLETVFGDVPVSRLAYRRKRRRTSPVRPQVQPARRGLLPRAEAPGGGGGHSGSFDAAVDAIEGERPTAGKRQVEGLALRRQTT